MEKKAKRLEQEEREEQGKQKAINDELDWIRPLAQGPPDQVQGPHPAFDELVEAQENRTPGKAQILIQVPERLGGNVIDAKGLTKAYGDKLLFDDLSFSLAAGRHRRRDRPQRRRQDHLVQADHRRRAARRRRDQDRRRPVQLGYVDQTPRRARPEAKCLGGDFGRPRHVPLRQA